MPCTSGYTEPNEQQKESQRVNQLLFYLYPEISKFEERGKMEYGHVSTLDEDTNLLCDTCKGFTQSEQERYLYDGRNKNARKLADWWEEHQEFDKKRELAEKKTLKDKIDRENALKKLTPKEREILGL